MVTILDEMVGQIESLRHNMTVVMTTVSKELTNKELPLDHRWKIFHKLCDLDAISEISTFYCDRIRLLSSREISYYDDFNIEKYETVYYVDLWRRIQENLKGEAYKPRILYTPEAADAWREAVLATGQAGFRYDW